MSYGYSYDNAGRRIYYRNLEKICLRDIPHDNLEQAQSNYIERQLLIIKRDALLEQLAALDLKISSIPESGFDSRRSSWTTAQRRNRSTRSSSNTPSVNNNTSSLNNNNTSSSSNTTTSSVNNTNPSANNNVSQTLNASVTDCCVCFESQLIILTRCGHAICENCTAHLVQRKCPMCRSDGYGGYFDNFSNIIATTSEREQLIGAAINHLLAYYWQKYNNDNGRRYCDIVELCITEYWNIFSEIITQKQYIRIISLIDSVVIFDGPGYSEQALLESLKIYISNADF